jgi:Tfp pilus assembly protein PilE
MFRQFSILSSRSSYVNIVRRTKSTIAYDATEEWKQLEKSFTQKESKAKYSSDYKRKDTVDDSTYIKVDFTTHAESKDNQNDSFKYQKTCEHEKRCRYNPESTDISEVHKTIRFGIGAAIACFWLFH